VNIDQDTFCAAPWFQIRNDNQGEYRSCCQIRPQQSKFQGQKNFVFPQNSMADWINSDYVQYIRESLTSGNKIPECNECWQKESSGQLSLRNTINNTVTENRGDRLDKSWIHAYFKNKKNYESNLICSIDIKLTNLCNYSCVMCHPQDSTQIMSKWMMQQEHPGLKNRLKENPDWQNDSQNLINDKNRYDLLNQAINLRPQHLKILGGEPLIDQTMFKILSSVPIEQKKDINLLFVTNASVDLSGVQDDLPGWKGVYFVVSLDGIDAVQDYIRHGSNWQDIKKNMIQYLSHRPGNQLWVHYTVQALTLYHLPELLEFCHHHKIELSTGMLNEPDFLALSAIPDELRSKIIDKLSIAEKLPGSWGDRAKGNRKLLEISRHDPNLIGKMWEYLSWYDPMEKWKTVFPEWIPYESR
jgi:wyosine [tRNA(Phe)-imidazoG37] synthetase (radical SAM superfamily)